MTKRLAYVIFALTIAFFGIFFAWPIWQVLKGGFMDGNGHFTMAYILAVLDSHVYMKGILNSIFLGVVTTILALLIALPLAYFADRYQFPGKKFFVNIVLLPIMLPPFVGAIGIQQIFGTRGVINLILLKFGIIDSAHLIDWLGNYKFLGMCLLSALSLYPILYLNILSSLANIDPAMEEAAGNLGCHGLRRYFKITFPLIRSGVFAGSTLVFIWAFTELGVPLIFDYNRVVSVQIYNGLKEIGSKPTPYALVSVVLALSLVFYLIGKIAAGRQNYAMMAKASQSASTRKIGIFRKMFCCVLFLGITFAAIMPHLSVVITSFAGDWYNSILPNVWTLNNYKITLGHPLTIPAIKNSLVYSCFATLVTMMLGIAISFVVVRSKIWGRDILDTITMLPLAVPGLVMAFGYLAMSQKGRGFEFLNPIENPTMLLILSYSVRKLPFMVRSAVAGLQQMSYSYEEAAQNLGCSPLKASLIVTFPLIIANLLAGGLLVFSQTMLEVSDSLILAQKQQFYPITKAIYELMNLFGDGPFLACALGVWSMAFLATTIVGASIFMGKNFGVIFRA
ncbi:MAG: iron ABC transporter permease [Puniceicoccales bacterium]|jgi:iron(III) transport system permease protein|nr:iron ABC transporter permease [Puniceicoccales bacterium]